MDLGIRSNEMKRKLYEGQLYKTGHLVSERFSSDELTVGEVLVRLGSCVTPLHIGSFTRIIFLRENGEFFTTTMSDRADSVDLGWLGIHSLL